MRRQKTNSTLGWPSITPLAGWGFAGLALLMLSIGCDSEAEVPIIPGKEANAVTVQLEIDFTGNKSNLLLQVPCPAETTVYQLLETAKRSGELEFQATGSGETAFVKSISGVQNRGAAGDNWVFRVNDRVGDQSCGTYPVSPGDRVKWIFGKYP